jgi:hypothetical protein
MNSSNWAATLLLLVVVSGCAADQVGAPRVPEPGTLVVSLSAPTADVGAVLIRLEGPEIKQAEPADSAYRMFVQETDSAGGATHLAIIGTRLNGPLVVFAVPDVSQEAAYSATIMSVADHGNRLIEETSPYRLKLGRR